MCWYGQNKAPSTILRLLREEGIAASRSGIRKPGSGLSSKVNEKVKNIAGDKMTLDDGTKSKRRG